MKVRPAIILTLILAAVVFSGCERRAYPLANVEEPRNAPDYTVEPRIHPPPPQ